MEQKTEQLEQSVIDKLKSIQEEQNNMIIALGQSAVRKRQLQAQIADIESQEKEFGERIDKSISDMNTELAELDVKYPNGQIDLEAGTVLY
jgi:aromatic ring-opening dioxygenase catalytic subunit (LigB family)